MSFDLGTIEVVETTLVHLVDANDEKLFDSEGNPVQIEIYGKGSKAYKQALTELNRKNIQRKGKQQNLSTIMEDNVELLAAVSKASYNLNVSGAPVSTLAAFKALYANPKLFFIKETVQAALDDNSNFLQR